MVRDPQQADQESCVSGCLFNVIPWAVLAVLFVGALVGIIASTWAMPGDRLYPIKRFYESTRLELTRVPSQRVDLEISYDQLRFEEVASMQAESRSGFVELTAGFSEVTADDEWLVGGTQVLISPDTEMVGRINRGTYITVFGELQEDGSIAAERIQPREYAFADRLHSVASNQWLVDGVTVFVAHDTILHGSPAIGSDVSVIAQRLLNDQMVARLIEEMP